MTSLCCTKEQKQNWWLNWSCLLHSMQGLQQRESETKRTVEQSIKEHRVKIANKHSAIAEHHQNTCHKPALDNIKVLRRKNKLIP